MIAVLIKLGLRKSLRGILLIRAKKKELQYFFCNKKKILLPLCRLITLIKNVILHIYI